MVSTSLSILVTGSSNTPHLELTSATNAFQQALILKTLACMTGEAQGQAGKACHVVQRQLAGSNCRACSETGAIGITLGSCLNGNWLPASHGEDSAC